MTLDQGSTLHGFTIERREELPEIDGEAYVGRHEVSGARLLYLKNDDNNKSFSIGFRTPPKDDTGVFHILEHSVLCGSRRFPVKEPFVDLLKTSMQTFLNAMTFSDKTLYPVASTNERDLLNLMDVYLDAVFHPNIYKKRAIFEQEGWHYELKAIDGSDADAAALGADATALVYNGVVYNEMKGALSDSSSVLYDELQKALFPDTCYAFESGGTPAAIPTLTYEGYLEDHQAHYRTDNSYIILYGNLDVDRALAMIDERYLTPVAEEQRAADEERKQAGLEPLRPRAISMQAPRLGGFTRTTMDTAAENAVSACGYVIGNASDRVRAMAADILLDALFGSNEAPLKRALLDAGIAHDVNAFVSDSLLQPFAIVQLSMPAEGAAEQLHETLAQAVRDMLDRGLDKNLVEAALSHAEFVMREHDTSYADGVIYAMVALSSWLYDDEAATDYLRYERAFTQLREALKGDYFERLCSELFLENAHAASVEIVPTPGQSDDDTSERLAAMNKALSADERRHIVEEEALLRELQEAPDDPADVAKLPRLGIGDIEDVPDEPAFALDPDAPLACVRHTMPTRGISYAYRYFDMSCMAFDDLPYLSVLALVLGKLDTAHHTAAEIDTLSQGKLGNLSFYVDVYDGQTEFDTYYPELIVSASALSENVEWLSDLPREIMLETDFSNTDKILDLLKQRKIAAEQNFANNGHQCATSRVRSYFMRSGVVREQLGNVGLYRFLCDLIENYDERRDELSERLRDVAERVFCDDGCLISFAGSDEDYKRFWESHPSCGRTRTLDTVLDVPEPVVLNEAFAVPSDVCFAALAWDSHLLEAEYSGTWAIAGRALSYDYLWNEVRVKGGAYGVGFQALSNGAMRFYSYRDPHLDDTLERFAKSAAWLSESVLEHEQLEGYVVATVAKLDAPIKPRSLAKRQAADVIIGRSPEERKKVRREIIACSEDDIRAFSSLLGRMVQEGVVCVFGNKAILEASKADLTIIDLIG